MSKPSELDPAILAGVHGGMQFYEDDRMSTNVEDRRTPEGKARDQAWFEKNRDQYSPVKPASERPTGKGSEILPQAPVPNIGPR